MTLLYKLSVIDNTPRQMTYSSAPGISSDHSPARAPMRQMIARPITIADDVMLATAIIRVARPNGALEPFRALIDSCAQSCSITTECAQRLQLKVQRIAHKEIYGVGNVITEKTHRLVTFKMVPRDSEPIMVSALVMREITRPLSRRKTRVSIGVNFEGIDLADPYFYHPGRIDILLLGADVYCDLMKLKLILKLI